MIGISSPAFIGIGVVATGLVLWGLTRRQSTVQAAAGGMYVVKRWEVAHQPNEQKEYVRITGRQEGIIAWFLSYFGIDPTVHMVVTDKNFHIEARTFFGYAKQTIPVSKISEVHSGFARAWLAPLVFWFFGLACFAVAFGALFNGEIQAMLAMLFLATVFFGVGYLIYFFWRYLYVGVQGAGGLPAVINFKPSFIEGKTIDADSAEVAGRIIQALVNLKS